MNDTPTTRPGSDDQVTTVLAEIVSLIHQRGYVPGDRVPSERELTDRFKVGRAVVREAMTILESMRYVERRRGSGVFLCKDSEATSLETLVLFSRVGLPLGKKVHEDSVEVRKIVEVQAIQLACARRTDENLSKIDSILATFEDSADFGARAPRYDYDFHLEILRATGNDILVRLLTPFYIMSEQRRREFFSDHARCVVSHAQHLKMAQAIRDRDPSTAAVLMEAHIGRVDAYFNVDEPTSSPQPASSLPIQS